MFLLCIVYACWFFFFKQKTAYEMRISDWSSDVCSSDLPASRLLAQPAQVRAAARGLFDEPISSILALRADQLGDVSASLPAMVRLRSLFPNARFTALVQPSVRSVVEASGIVDEVLTIRLDYNEATERRLLSVDEEKRVRSIDRKSTRLNSRSI